MTRAEFLGALQNIMNNFVFGHVLIRIAAEADLSYLQHETAKFECSRSEASVKLDTLFNGVSSLKQRPVMVSEFQGSLRRAVIAEFFECIKIYCQATGQVQALKNASWYEFVRVIRNTTSHQRGGHISWPPEFKKKGVKTACWNHLEINESMEGQELVMYDSDILLLLKDLTDFAEQQIA